MDSYFKAAVSDLDKLLDEFEQDADETETNRFVNPCDPKHHVLSLELDYHQPEFLGLNVQEAVSSCATTDESSVLTKTASVAKFEHLNSEQNEKNVAGLDLLSMVDGSSSDKNQSSLGRCSIPVCDLINDTGNLSHGKNNSEYFQKLQFGDFPCSTGSFTGFDKALLPATACNLSVDCNAGSETQQTDEGGVHYNMKNNAAETPGELETSSLSEQTAVDTGVDQGKSETLSNSEIGEQLKQNVDLNRSPLTEKLTSTIHGSKDELTYEKGKCEPLEDVNHATTEVLNEESGRQAFSEDAKIESEDSDLPNTSELNKDNLMLPKEENLYASLLQSEESICSPEDNANITLKEISASEVSEDTQTSLSCLPLAVSICGSLVATDDPSGETGIACHLTLFTEKEKSIIPKEDTFQSTEVSEQDGNLTKTSQCRLGKLSFAETKEVASKCELFQTQDTVATFSSSLDADTEICEHVPPADIRDKSSVDLTLEDDVVGSDVLISDAELDAFLSGHCPEEYHPKPLKGDRDVGLLESDVVLVNLEDVNQLNAKSESLQAERAFEKAEVSVANNCLTSNPEPSLGILEEKSTQQIQQETSECVTEINSEISDHTEEQQMAHRGGARPKQLLNLPSKLKISSELNNPNTPESELQMTNPIIPNSSLSDSKVCPDSGSRDDHPSPQTCLENRGHNASPVSSENAKVGVQAVAPGQNQPPWVPDSEAPNCMNCKAKFTFTKRRHHCRACGKVFCTSCCNRKCKLQYLDKEARVCISCYETINKVQAFERMMSPTGSVSDSGILDYSTAPSLQETQTPGLKEQRRVWFADGILPNGEVADTTKLSSGIKRSTQETLPVESSTDDTVCATDTKPKDDSHSTGQTESLCSSISDVLEEDTFSTIGQSQLSHNLDSLAAAAAAEFSSIVELEKHPVPLKADETSEVPVSPLGHKMLCSLENYVGKEISLISEDSGLPPLLLSTGEKEAYVVKEHPSHQQVTSLFEESNPVTFILNANLLVNVRLQQYCSERCWFFSTNGLHSLGQAEIIILLHCLPVEDEVPKEIFKLFVSIYKDAVKGKFLGDLDNITFTEGFLGSKDHGGFLFVKPSFQKLDDLVLPGSPFLCGILIQKQEVPWAKVFPIRLMLRLGAEYGVYPTPFTSIRHRKSLFGEIGHTVMNLLVDLRNYQYTLHTIDNLYIHMEMGKSCIKIPLKRYNEIMKVINTSNEHVISIGASFSFEADSHLVCVQNDDGVYQTQANSATGHPRKITGASFVVFNGALKASSGFLAKSSIVEDGIMVQITPEDMDSLRQALRERKDFRITCGKVDSGDLREYVDICWVQSKERTNVNVTSPIDGKSMEGVQSEKIVQEENFEMHEKCIKCTEVFYLLIKANEIQTRAQQFAKEIALASCSALRQHLKTLKNNGMNKIGLRVSMDTDRVEYQAGSGGKLLPQLYLNDLDGALIPVIHGGTSNASNLPLEMELIFFITESLSV